MDKKVKPSELAGIYKEMAELIGIEATMLLHKEFQGQQISFPKKLYSKSFIMRQIREEKTLDVKYIASEYGCTERRLRQIIKESKEL